MKRKLIKRNKQKYTKLIQEAKSYGFSLSILSGILEGDKELKYYTRMRKRYGEVFRWDLVDYDNSSKFRSSEIVSVPIYTPKPHNKFLNMWVWCDIKDKPNESE